jgi:hypothetical protein
MAAQETGLKRAQNVLPEYRGALAAQAAGARKSQAR